MRACNARDGSRKCFHDARGGRLRFAAAALLALAAAAALALESSSLAPFSGARPGDALYVTGPLGGSLLGHHLSFEPRVREAESLTRQLGQRLHAMIDITDGLSLDLWRLCTESKVGAVLDERQLRDVISEDAKRAAATSGRTPLDHALTDGEDFELLMAVEGEAMETKFPLFRVGRITESELTIARDGGNVELLIPRGYVH